jgi:hypothetical protein
MRFKSLAKELKGTVLEILGTAFSVGCQVDGRSPKEISDDIKSGEIDSKLLLFLQAWNYVTYHSAQFLTSRRSVAKVSSPRFRASAEVNSIFLDKAIVEICQRQSLIFSSLPRASFCHPFLIPSPAFPSSSFCFRISTLLLLAQPPPFANTLALTSFPSWIGNTYGIGLFWCKEDRTFSDTLLTTASCLERGSGCRGPSNCVYIVVHRVRAVCVALRGGCDKTVEPV